MRSMPVVLVQPRPEGAGALFRVGIRAGVSPLAQAGLHQAFGLAVGAGRIGSCAQVAHAEAANEATEAARLVAGTVIGQDAFEAHAQCPVIANCLHQGPAGTDAAFIGLDGAEGDARVVVDSQVDVFPTDAVGVDLSIASDTMAGLAEAGQLLDIQMQELAGPGDIPRLGRGRQLCRGSQSAGARHAAWRKAALVLDMAKKQFPKRGGS